MANIKWKSGVSGDWNTASDWVGGVPGASDAVTIAASGNYTVTIDHSEAAQSVTLSAAGATLAESGKNVTLTLGTGLTVSAGTLSLIGSLGGTDVGFLSTQAIQGGFVDVSSHGVLSMALPSGAGSSEYSTNITSSVDLEGTTNVGTQTELVLSGGGVLGGTFAGLGKVYLTGSYLANGVSFGGLNSLEVDSGGFYVTTNSGSFTNFAAQDSSTLSVASGLTVTVSGELDIGQPPTAIFPEHSSANVFSGPGTLVTADAAYVYDNSQGTTELTVGGGLTWINSGELNFDGAVIVNQSQGDSFTLINQAGGTVLFEQPGGLTLGHTGTDLFTNAGDLDASGVVTLAIPIDDTGTIDPGGSLTMLTLSGGGMLGGVLDDNGTLVLNGQYTLAAGGLVGDPTLGNGNLVLDDGVLDIGTSSTFAGGFGTDGGNDELVMAAGADFTLSGAATIGQTAVESPNLYIIGPGTLTTLGTTTFDDAGSGVSLVHETTWVNGGSVIDNVAIDLGDTTTASDVETIVNEAGATFDIEGPDGGIAINGAGTGMFDNVGTLVRGSDSGTSTIAATLSNSGTIDVTSGTLALTGGGVINGEVDGSGTLLLSAGHFTVAQPGHGNGHIVVGAGATVSYATVLDGYNTLTLNSGQIVTYGGTLTIGDGSGGYIVSGPGTFATTGQTSISDLDPSVTFYVEGTATWSNTGTANVLGTVDFGNPGAFNGANDSGTLVNKGVFNLVGDDSALAPGDYADGGAVTNSGTFAKTSGTGTSTISVGFTTTKLVNVASGTLALTGGGSIGGTLTGAGVLALDSTTYSLTSPTLAGTGTLALALGGILSQTSNTTIAANVVWAGGTYETSAPQTLTTSGQTTVLDAGTATQLDIYTGTWTNTGTVSAAGDVSLFQGGYNGSGSSGYLINRGTYDLTTDDAGVSSGVGSGSLTNTGTLAKLGGSGTSTIVVPLLNSGLINVATGTIDAMGGGTLGGTLSGAGTLALTGSFTDSSLAGTGHLVLTGGSSLTETATGALAPSLTLAGGSTLTIASGVTSTVSGQLGLADANGYTLLSGPGTLSTTGTTSLFDGGAGALTFVANGGVTWLNSGTVNDAGFSYVAYGGGAGNASVTNSGTFNFTTDDSNLTIYDTSTTDTFTNTGKLAKTAGAGTSTIGLAVNDTGTIAVTSGTLALTGGGLVAGALSGGGLLDMSTGTFTSTGITGTGNLAITGGAMLTGTATGTIATSVLVGGNASLLASPKATILSLTGPVTLGDANGYGIFSGAGTIATTGATTILDNGAGALTFVGNGGVTWANNGTVNDAGFGYVAYGGGAGSANIANSGTFNFTTDDSSLTIYDSSTTDIFTNTGLLAKTAGTATSQIGLAIKSTGSIAVASGTLALTGGGLVSGTLTGGGLLDLSVGSFTSTGIAGTGHLAITGGATLTETATGTIATSVAVGGNASLLASPKTDNLTLSGPVTLGDANGYGIFSGPGTIATTGATTIIDNGAGALTFVGNGGVTWANSGTVNDAGFGYVAYGGGAGSANIANSGTFNLTTDDANLTIYDSSTTDTFTNTGTLAKTAGTGTSQVGLAIKDTGTIAVASGTLALSGGGLVSGALSGAGLLDLSAGTFTSIGIAGTGHLAVTGSALLTETATGTIATSLAVGGNATLLASPKATVLTLSGPVTLGDPNGYGVFSGPGTIATTGVTTIVDNGAGALTFVANGGLTWANSGTVNDSGFGYFAYGGGAGGATIVNSGTFNLTSDDASLTIYDSSSSDTFTNTGLLAKTGGTGTSQINVAISNTGTIEAARGTLQLTSAIAGAGNLKIDAGATLDIAGTLPASQKVSFNGGSGATLKLETPASIGTLTNFSAGDQLDLVGVSVTSTKVTGTTLTVVTSSGTYTYVSAGIANEVVTTSNDGEGGTFVSLYRGAIPTHTPEPLAFGNLHVGSTTGTTAFLTVTNTAPADGYSEKLNAKFGGASAGFTASGTVTGLAGGASNSTSLSATIDASTAGTKSGTATLTLASNGAGIDGRGTTALPSQTVNLTGAVYNYAAAGLAGTKLNLGIIHASTAASGALTLTNTAPAGGYSEALDAGLSNTSAGLSASGSITGLAAGMTDGSTLLLTVNMAASGAYSGTALLGLVSDGKGIDGLGTTTLTGQTITVQATVDNYAVAALEDPSGPALSGTSTNETLNLGSVAQGGAALSATIGARNAATGTADQLGGTFSSAGGAGFSNTGLGTFSVLSAGQDEHAQTVSLATGTVGTFTETVVLSSYGTNASGYDGALTPETLTVIGTVTASTYTTYTLASGPNVIQGADGLGDVFIATAAAINNGDQLTGGNGSNSLSLVGAGTFNLNAPSVLTNIPTIDGVEGQAGTGGKKGKPDTRQTIRLRNSTTETLTIAAGTPASGNKSPESVSITAGTGTYTINLAGGADAVTLGAGPATVTLGGAANSVAGGSGTALVRATAAFAGASVVGTSGSPVTLEVTGGGNATLNAADTYLTVKLDAAGALKLSGMAFVTAVGSSGADTLTSLAGTQTLTGGAGADTLVGFSGGNDTFADLAAGLNGDTIKGWTTGDVIDVKDFASATLKYASNTLTITNGSASTAIKFGAGLTLSNFTVLGSDGASGVLIGYHG